MVLTGKNSSRTAWLSVLLLALPLSAEPSATDADAAEIEHIVVTAVAMKSPLTVVTNPKLPRQPLPAHDGADYLSSITGFNLIRKGGASSDPLFRGMAGSRLNILTDGDMLLGGCGSRMDPPTAYIAPQAYDKLTIIKGPQTVSYGPGSSAATVLFERNNKRLTEAGISGSVNSTAATAGRLDNALDVTTGNRTGFARAIATYARSDDYRDDNTQRIHSAYQRWSSQLELGDLSFSPNRGVVSIGEHDIPLTLSESRLLEALLKQPGEPLDKQELAQLALGRKLTLYDRSLDMHVSNLRKKIGPHPDGRPRIVALRSRGYYYSL